MADSWSDIFSTICECCGGRCCFEAHPPLTDERISLLRDRMDLHGCVEYKGYKRFTTGNDGYCIMLNQSRCSINGFKPETCMAGPFTFDVRRGFVEIYLKKPSICPLVTLLQDDPGAFRSQFETAQRHILRLVGSLSDEELMHICSVDEPEIEKIAEIPLHG